MVQEPLAEEQLWPHTKNLVTKALKLGDQTSGSQSDQAGQTFMHYSFAGREKINTVLTTDFGMTFSLGGVILEISLARAAALFQGHTANPNFHPPVMTLFNHSSFSSIRYKISAQTSLLRCSWSLRGC
jgi:hypothetical protein